MMQRSAPLTFTLLLLVSGCAKQTGGNEPAWPEQPSPSYPAGSAAEEAPHPAAEGKEPEAPAADQKGSTLAKEYGDEKAQETFKGQASYYADSLAGNHTASGDVYDPKEFTAAHRKLPFGTVLRIVREDTGAVTYARVNDRGPFGEATRVIDLSRAAAEELEMMKAGVVEVRVEVVSRPDSK